MIPMAIFVFSGKRKSGKDYVANLMLQKLTEAKCGIMRLSAPLKGQYAKDHKLTFERLKDSSDYKEKYRADMIRFGEDKREQDPGYFCRLATSEEWGEECKKAVWIISDARRRTDLDYFFENYTDRVRSVRIIADEDVRQERGYSFSAGIDDAESECGLDNFKNWDFRIDNNGNENLLISQIDAMINSISVNKE